MNDFGENGKDTSEKGNGKPDDRDGASVYKKTLNITIPIVAAMLFGLFLVAFLVNFVFK